MAETGRIALIDEEEKRLSIQKQCALVGLARVGYYYTPLEETDEDLDIMSR